MTHSSQILRCIRSGEGECVEFKTASNGVHDDTFETVCSFANHHGGEIFLGVNDSGRVVGLPHGSIDETMDYVRARCTRHHVFSRRIRLTIECVEVMRHKIIHIHVSPSRTPVTYKGVAYQRLGSNDYRR